MTRVMERDMAKDKYDDWLAERKVPAKMSIIELEVLAKKLGIDADAMRNRHYDALQEELWEAIKAKGFTIDKS